MAPSDPRPDDFGSRRELLTHIRRAHGRVQALAFVDRCVAAGDVTQAAASLLRAEVYYFFGHAEPMRECLAQIDAAPPDWSVAELELWYLLRGRELHARGQTAEALTWFERAIALGGRGSDLAVARLDALQSLQRITDAEYEDALAARIADDPDDFLVEGVRAEMYMRRHDYAAATRCAQRVLELLPGDTYGLHLLGKICFLQRRFAEATTYLERAAESNPENAERLLILILLYAIQQDRERLLQTCYFATRQYPQDPRFHEKLAHALLLYAPREHERSLAHARRAHALEPANAGMHVVLAFCLAAAGRWEECAAVAREIRAGGVPDTSFDFSVLEEQIREHVVDHD